MCPVEQLVTCTHVEWRADEVITGGGSERANMDRCLPVCLRAHAPTRHVTMNGSNDKKCWSVLSNDLMSSVLLGAAETALLTAYKTAK